MKKKLFIACLALLAISSCKDDNPVPEYSVTVTNERGGIASASTTKTTAGETVTLTATPDEGYLFDKWTVVSGSITLSPDASTTPATFTMPNSNVSIRAEFVKRDFMFDITTDGNGTVTVTIDGNAATQATAGDKVTLTATPAKGYLFDKWTVLNGNLAILLDETTNPVIFTMPAGNVSIKAEFDEEQITLSDPAEMNQTAFADEETTAGFTFTAKSAWKATITGIPTDLQTPTVTRASTVPWLRLLLEGAETYSGEAGQFSLNIVLDPNYTGETRIATITITCGDFSITITVIQKGTNEGGEVPKPAYTIDITNDDNGTAKATIDGNIVTQVVKGETVTLTATPVDGYIFDKWTIVSGKITLLPDVTTNPATFIMPDEDVIIKPEFVQPEYTIIMNDDGNGTATATIDGNAVTQTFAGETVTLTATPVNGYLFDHWTVVSGGVTLLPNASTTPATFTMPAGNVDIQANFKPIPNPQSSYYGTWINERGFGNDTFTVTISENKIEFVCQSANGVFGYTIEGLTWAAYNNPENNADYISGYKITGTAKFLKDWELFKDEYTVTMNEGDQVLVRWYISNDGLSLKEGQPSNTANWIYIKQP